VNLEVQLLERINRKRNELEEKRAAKADEKVLSKLETEINFLTDRLINFEKQDDNQAFEENCRG
jgi:hypothetical protein